MKGRKGSRGTAVLFL